MRAVLFMMLVARVALAADGGTSTSSASNFLNCRVTQDFSDGGQGFVVTIYQTPLPLDAARASKQPALGTPGHPSKDVLSVQGVPFGKPLPVDASGTPVQVYGVVSLADAGSLPLPAGASTEATLALIKAKTDNIDVAVSTRTKPADQQHVIVDTIPSTAVTGPLTDTQLRASVVPVYVDGGVLSVTQGTSPWSVSGPLTDTQLRASVVPVYVDGGVLSVTQGTSPWSVSGPLTDTQLRATAVPISLATAPTTPITAAALPLPSGAATDATLSLLLDGGVAAIVAAVTAQPQMRYFPVPVNAGPAPLNPFLPRCNAVRKTRCQP